MIGLTIVWAWVRLRAGEQGLLLVTALIGLLYWATGLGGMVYRHADPFMAVFITEGVVLLAATSILNSGRTAPATRQQQLVA